MVPYSANLWWLKMALPFSQMLYFFFCLSFTFLWNKKSESPKSSQEFYSYLPTITAKLVVLQV